MKKTIYGILIGLLLLLAGSLLQAEDEIIVDAPGGANDPATNEAANACFRGGTLAGKCSSTDVDGDGDVDATDRVWMWNAGWYLIRFEGGETTRESFEPFYEAILPPLPQDVIDEDSIVIGAGCRRYLGGFLDFGAGNFLPVGVPIYSDAACTTAFSTRTTPSVYAPGGASIATTICITNGFVYGTGPYGDSIHRCA